MISSSLPTDFESTVFNHACGSFTLCFPSNVATPLFVGRLMLVGHTQVSCLRAVVLLAHELHVVLNRAAVALYVIGEFVGLAITRGCWVVGSVEEEVVPLRLSFREVATAGVVLWSGVDSWNDKRRMHPCSALHCSHCSKCSVVLRMSPRYSSDSGPDIPCLSLTV